MSIADPLPPDDSPSGVLQRAPGWLGQLPAPQLLVVLTLGAGILAFAAALLFAQLAHSELSSGGATSIDQQVNRWVLAHRSEGLTDVLRPATNLADGLVVAVVSLVAVSVLARQRRRWLAGSLVITSAGTAMLIQTVKAIIDGPRPVPSERLVTATAGALAAGVAALVGVSRIYLGVHWTSDVVAGWALGLAWLTGTSAMLVLWSSIRRLDLTGLRPSD